MADNYLENKMEEYRSGKLRTFGKPQVTGPGVFRVKGRNVWLGGIIGNTALTIARAFAASGCKVGFAIKDMHSAQLTAQQTGARVYPMDETEALRRFAAERNAPDMLVVVEDASKSLIDTFAEVCADHAMIVGLNIMPQLDGVETDKNIVCNMATEINSVLFLALTPAFKLNGVKI